MDDRTEQTKDHESGVSRRVITRSAAAGGLAALFAAVGAGRALEDSGDDSVDTVDTIDDTTGDDGVVDDTTGDDDLADNRQGANSSGRRGNGHKGHKSGKHGKGHH